MSKGRRDFGLLAFMLVLFGLLAYGQAVDGNILGTVLDSQGAAVVGAEVSIINLGTGVASTTKTNGTGDYRFDHLPVGNYRLTAKMTGFRPISEKVDVVLNKTGTSNLTLTPGAATETVEVSGAPPSIEASAKGLPRRRSPDEEETKRHRW